MPWQSSTLPSQYSCTTSGNARTMQALRRSCEPVLVLRRLYIGLTLADTITTLAAALPRRKFNVLGRCASGLAVDARRAGNGSENSLGLRQCGTIIEPFIFFFLLLAPMIMFAHDAHAHIHTHRRFNSSVRNTHWDGGCDGCTTPLPLAPDYPFFKQGSKPNKGRVRCTDWPHSSVHVPHTDLLSL